jgi:hypothetical protein
MQAIFFEKRSKIVKNVLIVIKSFSYGVAFLDDILCKTNNLLCSCTLERGFLCFFDSTRALSCFTYGTILQVSLTDSCLLQRVDGHLLWTSAWMLSFISSTPSKSIRLLSMGASSHVITRESVRIILHDCSTVFYSEIPSISWNETAISSIIFLPSDGRILVRVISNTTAIIRESNLCLFKVWRRG